jgi:hypothetical protein
MRKCPAKFTEPTNDKDNSSNDSSNNEVVTNNNDTSRTAGTSGDTARADKKELEISNITPSSY